MRRVFYDTEFIEDGRTIDLISIGMVDDRGNEFYGVSVEFDSSKASPWVRENVMPKLPWDRRKDRNGPWMSRRQIAGCVLSFLTSVITPSYEREPVELWAYYAAYDHVALAQLFGRMIDLPPGIPKQTDDLMTLWKLLGEPQKPPQPANQHDALADARWGHELWKRCQGRDLG